MTATREEVALAIVEAAKTVRAAVAALEEADAAYRRAQDAVRAAVRDMAPGGGVPPGVFMDVAWRCSERWEAYAAEQRARRAFSVAFPKPLLALAAARPDMASTLSGVAAALRGRLGDPSDVSPERVAWSVRAGPSSLFVSVRQDCRGVVVYARSEPAQRLSASTTDMIVRPSDDLLSRCLPDSGPHGLCSGVERNAADIVRTGNLARAVFTTVAVALAAVDLVIAHHREEPAP